ncbi:hypothetical protein HZS_7803, partial [Henneguya salminicola]
ISYHTFWYDKTYFRIKFNCVKIEYLDNIIDIFKKMITEIKKNGLEKTFLNTVVRHEYCTAVIDFENTPHSIIANRAIDFFLYGKNSLEFLNIMEEIKSYHTIADENDEFWNAIVQKYFDIDRLFIIKAIPAQSNDILNMDETKIVKSKELESKEPRRKIRKPPPTELLEKFPIPKMDDVNFHDIKTLCNFGGFNFEDLSLHNFEIFNVPLAMQIDDIRSNTVTVTLCVCLGKIQKDILRYLPIASMFPFEMPVFRKGVLLSHEEVKKELDLMFISRFSDIGWNSGHFNLGIMPYYYFISLKTDIYHYEDAVSWIKDLLFNYKCDVSQIKTLILNLYQAAKSTLETGTGSVNGLSNLITFKKDTINHFQSVFSQIEYLQILYQKIKINVKEVNFYDSSYLIQTLPSLNSYRDMDYPPLTVLLEFLSAFEGPLWKKLRGKGLAYTAIIYCEPSDGLIYFKISKATDIVRAYEEALIIMRACLCEVNEFIQEDLESAISGVIFEVVNQESNICDAAMLRMLAQLKGLDYEFHREFIKKILTVTVGDLKEMALKYLKPIVEHANSHIAISCPASDLNKI